MTRIKGEKLYLDYLPYLKLLKVVYRWRATYKVHKKYLLYSQDLSFDLMMGFMGN